MGALATLAASLEELALELDTLERLARRHPSPELAAALNHAQLAFTALRRFVHALDDDDLADTQSLERAWHAVARVQDDVRRARRCGADPR
jgi:hypothetical protein